MILNLSILLSTRWVTACELAMLDCIQCISSPDRRAEHRAETQIGVLLGAYMCHKRIELYED